MERCPTSCTTPLFREKFGDHVWRIQRKNAEWSYLLIMLEFQSTVDDWMPLRILIYTGLLWEGLIATDQLCNGKLPLVLPIVLYNGDKRWTTPLDIADLILPCTEQLSLYQPKQQYVLLDENRINHEILQKNNDSISTRLIRLEQTTNPQELEQTLYALLNSVRQYHELLKVIIAWVNSVLKYRWINEQNIHISQLEGENSMLADRIRQWEDEFIRKGKEEGRIEGIEQGIKKGRAEGRIEGRAEGIEKGILTVAKKMLAGNLPVEQILQFTGLPLETIQKLATKI